MADSFQPLVCVVDFHHHRGPEIEHWIGAEGSDPTVENDWQLIPYMALPDGAHQSEEEFSYFSLVHKARAGRDVQPSSVFGISCVHQIDSSQLLFRPEEVTRSAVQKAVVAITDKPQSFSALREKLSAVTGAWFAQRDFRDIEILQRFQESLAREGASHEDERDQYFGLSLRELVHTFRWQILVLLKCMLLQRKILFFGSHCERICQVQFSLISLIPGLVRSLRDCADPQMDLYAERLRPSDSVRTSDRTSLLAYVGLPLQLFGKGSMFGPYTPLQQLDTITDQETKSYVLGSTNSLLLGQKERYCDLLVNLDENTMTILSPTLKPALTLSVADRRWIDFLTQAVNDTWDENDPSRPTTHGYAGSEEFIRLQFEEYLIALLSATKYHQYLAEHKDGDPKALLADVEGDPAAEFSIGFVEAWQQSENYKLWNRTTDGQLFDIVEPRHPCAGGLTIEDVQRRLAAQVAELHLDERFNQTREVVGKRLADGRVQVTSAFNKVWADIETMREAQRKRSEESRAAAAANPASEKTPPGASKSQTQAQASVAAASQRAGAYLSSWGSWAAEKRKSGWGRSTSTTAAPTTNQAPSAGDRPKVTTVSELHRSTSPPAVTGPANGADKERQSEV
ncbi:Late secretory pathway AVL9 [Lecanosticta acicola]|uniref:Late secretory pathway AVL9 n=1 Tax=Lecanosticta acicola TaxID=111012 RepID=A0AAI8Z279_9PEZI|nr:Late secretory pathway AVL9 [Lecanosticta acicola]